MAKTEAYLEIFKGSLDQAKALPHPEIAQIFMADVLAALASARIVRKVFYGVPLNKLQVEYKEDETPKTIADIEGDFAIYKAIRRLRPYDEMLLEETGYHKGLPDLHPTIGSKVRHYADSLDGSRPFVEGKPWSTVGVGAVDENGDYLTGVIVHPFRQQMAVAIRELGAYLIPLNARLLPAGEPQRLQVSNKDSLTGGTVGIDSLFPVKNPYMREMKHKLMAYLEAIDISSYDMIGSNIAYQLDVAQGKSVLGFTDAVGGPWDWRIGQAIICEAGGIMMDVVRLQTPNDFSQALIYGNKALVNRVLPEASKIYNPFMGFNVP